MAVSPKVQSRRVFAGLLLAAAAPSGLLAEECSLAKTNHNCTLTIDRRNPVAPPTIQMYPKQEITVVVKNPYFFERYFLDYQSGQLALSPDVSAALLGALLTPLQKAGEFKANALEPVKDPCAPDAIAGNPPKPGNIAAVVATYNGCFFQFARAAQKIYLALEPAVAPDSRSIEVVPLPATNKLINDQLASLVDQISEQYLREAQLSVNIAAVDKSKLTTADLVPYQGLTTMTAAADAIAKDLLGFSLRIGDLPGVDAGQVSCDDFSQMPAGNENGDKGCVVLPPAADPPVANSKIVTRQVTYAVNALNLVQNSRAAVAASSNKKTIATISILYGDSRWEASAGTFFSTLPIRSFTVAPVITNGVVTDKRVTSNVLHPTIVPFVGANVRLTDDLPWSPWRSALYWTFAAGVNPNTVSADFATGPSLSWRALMVSALWHYGHDVRLTQGLFVGQALGAGFSTSATTETFWKSSFAVGVAVRVPALTGR